MFARLALILIFAGLGFRLTAVPFHFYAPDVYQGTTNPNAGLLAVVPKVAALVALARIAFVAMPGLERLGWQLSLTLALVTMTLGNLLALWQNNVRRLMAYSSIAHAGYMLIGLAVGFAVADGATEANDFDGVGASFFYLLVYAAATAGTFAALAYLSGAGARSIRSMSWPAWPSAIPRPPLRSRCSCFRSPACRRWPASGASSRCSPARWGSMRKTRPTARSGRGFWRWPSSA